MTMRLRAQTSLEAEPERVWAVLVDWEGQAAWMPDVARIRVLSPERGLGARLAVSTKVFGIPLATDLVRIIGWDPPRRLAVEHEGLVVGFGEWRLEPEPGGGTRFTWVEDLRMPPPVLGDVALWLYSPWQRWMLRRSVRNLARVVEAPTRAT
jgi:carbon monoxide dehydrogenase subunit G